MSSGFATAATNPYATPQCLSEAADASPAAAKTKHGSLAIVFAGFLLVLGGYFTSNIFLIADLYHVPFGPNGKVLSSPFAATFSTPAQQWMLYGACAAATIAGCIMVGSQAFNPLAAVAYIMCPLMAGIYLVASPLRIAQKWAFPVATFYLAVGSCLAGTGIIRLGNLYGQPGSGFEPVGASMLTEVGLALFVGAVVKLACTAPAQPIPASA
jgi:hypothetical protein